MRPLLLLLVLTGPTNLLADSYNGQRSSVLTIEDLDGDAIPEVVVLVRPLPRCLNYEDDRPSEDRWEEETFNDPQPPVSRERPPMTLGRADSEPILFLPRALVLSGASGKLLNQFQVGSFFGSRYPCSAGSR